MQTRPASLTATLTRVEDDAKGGIHSEHSAPAHILALVMALHAREVLAEAI